METNNIIDVLDSLNKGVYAGTAKRVAVKKRRAKNKAARRQRKVNSKRT